MFPKIIKWIIIKGTLYHKSNMKCLEWTIYSSYWTDTKPTGHTSIILSHACFCCATNSLQWVSVFIWVCLPYCRSWLLGSWLMSYVRFPAMLSISCIVHCLPASCSHICTHSALQLKHSQGWLISNLTVAIRNYCIRVCRWRKSLTYWQESGDIICTTIRWFRFNIFR